tara:strand:+ start:12175 stop:13476 length:1302 start_codon:yes stop_codon:yes gene_type:complete
MLSPNWPFKPSKTPFFYGWIICLFSTLGILFSIPGQTIGLAVFTDSFIDALKLSRTELSIAYFFGTFGSSLFLTMSGRWFDLYGGRIMITISSISLSLMILYISFIEEFGKLIGSSSGLIFLLILFGYFGVRFFGQGILTNCSRNILLLWFDKKRGLVCGIRSVFVSIGFSLSPLLLAGLISDFGWREALWILAGVGGIGFSIAAFLFTRDNPESCNLVVDGIDNQLLEKSNKEIIKSKTLKDAKRSPVYWIYALSLGMHAMFGTALVFHIVAIFSEAGRGSQEAYNYFFPTAIFSTTTNFFASWLTDKYVLKPFLITMLIAFCIGCWGLINLGTNWGFWILIIGFGVGGGLWGVITNLAYVRLFGSKYLGEISGFGTSISVFCSAVGPAAFSLANDYLGSYTSAFQICLVSLLVLLLVSLFFNQEELEGFKK